MSLPPDRAMQAIFRWDEEATVHPELYLPRGHYRLTRQAEGIWSMPLFSASFCKALCWISDLIGYESDLLDKYPGQEAAAEKILPLWRVLQTVFDCHLQHAVRAAFDFKVEKVERCFVLRYAMDSQRGMGLHHDDMSDVSVSVVLSSDWTGEGLEFPRQQWSSGGEPVGHAVLFPGKVTHPHYAPEITSGVRYSQTWWLKGSS